MRIIERYICDCCGDKDLTWVDIAEPCSRCKITLCLNCWGRNNCPSIKNHRCWHCLYSLNSACDLFHK